MANMQRWRLEGVKVERKKERKKERNHLTNTVTAGMFLGITNKTIDNNRQKFLT